MRNEHNNGTAGLQVSDRLLQCFLPLTVEVRVWFVKHHQEGAAVKSAR